MRSSPATSVVGRRHRALCGTRPAARPRRHPPSPCRTVTRSGRSRRALTPTWRQHDGPAAAMTALLRDQLSRVVAGEEHFTIVRRLSRPDNRRGAGQDRGMTAAAEARTLVSCGMPRPSRTRRHRPRARAHDTGARDARPPQVAERAGHRGRRGAVLDGVQGQQTCEDCGARAARADVPTTTASTTPPRSGCSTSSARRLRRERLMVVGQPGHPRPGVDARRGGGERAGARPHEPRFPTAGVRCCASRATGATSLPRRAARPVPRGPRQSVRGCGH